MLVTGVTLLTGQESFAVLVEAQVGDLDVGGVDGNLGLLAVCLLFDEFLNVDAPSAAVHFGHLAFTVLVRAAHNLHSVAVAHGDAARLVLGRQVLVQLRRHNLSALRGRGREVGLAGLSALA